jgi:hypothetical protein
MFKSSKMRTVLLKTYMVFRSVRHRARKIDLLHVRRPSAELRSERLKDARNTNIITLNSLEIRANLAFGFVNVILRTPLSSLYHLMCFVLMYAIPGASCE